MENQQKRDLTLHKEIKIETKAYEALCEKKSGKYTSFAEMRLKLTEEIKSYDKNERERLYEYYKNSAEKTNVFVSSTIPMLAAFAIGVLSFALTADSNRESVHCISKICDIHENCSYIEYNQGFNIGAGIAFLFSILILAVLILSMVRDSAFGASEKALYQMVIQIIESIEKGETKDSVSNPTNENCLVPQNENSDNASERSALCQPNTPSTCENPEQTEKPKPVERVKLSRVTSRYALKSQSGKVLRLRIFIKK